MDFGILGVLILFIMWGLFCFWLGRRPQEVQEAATGLGQWVASKFKKKPPTPPPAPPAT